MISSVPVSQPSLPLVAAQPFLRAGLASLRDLADPRWQAVLRELEVSQARFLDRQAEFRSKEYRWPPDALRWWSRIWEYPYVFEHLRRLAPLLGETPRVLDLGSGVTFFPFEVVRLGYRVSCTDIDPVCGPDLERAATLLLPDPKRLDFRRTDGSRLPFDDKAFDVVYCVSVLEHIPELPGTLAEISRVLRPGGRLLLTMDVAVAGEADLTAERYRQTMECLARAGFHFEFPETTVHPGDLLLSDRGPYPMPQPGVRTLAKEYLKQRVIKPLIGRRRGRFGRVKLAVHGSVLVKAG